MADDAPDLQADEAAMSTIAAELAEAVSAAIPGWIERIMVDRAAAAGVAITDDVRERLRMTGAATLALVGPRLREVIAADVDAGAGNPLAVLRDGVGPATEALRELGVPPVDRDDFAVRSFPDDVYDLGPAAFADVDDSLVEPGITWGAARAHVHLRRRKARS